MRALLKETFGTFSRRGGRVLGGAIAFYSLLSITPLLWIAVHVAGVLTSADRAANVLSADLTRWIGPNGANTVASMLAHAEARRGGPLKSALGVLFLAYASSRLFGALEYALNHLWGVQPRSGGGLRGLARSQLRRRSARFAMVLLVGALLVAMVLGKAVLAAAGEVVGGRLPVGPALHLLEALGSLLVTIGLFFAVFRVLPEVRIHFRDALLGAVVTALAFTAGSTAVGLYIGRKGIESAWGAAGSIVALLLWVHYSAQIFFLGAAFTFVWARREGRAIVPNEHSVAVVVDDPDAGE